MFKIYKYLEVLHYCVIVKSYLFSFLKRLNEILYDRLKNNNYLKTNLLMNYLQNQ